MQTLTYIKPNRLEQLCDELFAAIPALKIAQPDGSYSTTAQVYGTAAAITIVVDNAIPKATVDAVVAAHVATPAPVIKIPETVLKTSIGAAVTVADVTVALIAYATAKGG